MLKFRTSLLLAAILLCGCDHKKPPQTQTTTGAVPVAGDSAYTGVSSSTNTTAANYPRALPVSGNFNSTTASTSTKGSSKPAPALDLGVTPAPATASNAATSSPAPAASTSPTPAPATADNASSTPAPSTTPPAAADTASTSPPAPAPSTTSGVSSPSATSSGNEGDLPRLALNGPAPVAAATPSTGGGDEQVVVIDTSLGRIIIEPDADDAPKTSANFIKLAADGFYNHTTFHRVFPHFIIQGGDPNSLSEDRSQQGKGGPGYTLPPEIKLKHVIGAVAMARAPDATNPGRESNGSQFYICCVDAPSLDGTDSADTVFAHVIKGMDVVDAISKEPRDSHQNPITRIEMEVTVEPKSQAMSEAAASNP